MHTVTCPKCKNVLKLPKPVSNAKVRCAACQTVFVGSSVPVASSPPVVVQPQAGAPTRPARDDRARLYHGAPRQRTSTALVAGSIAGVVGVIVLAVVIGYNWSKKPASPKDPAPSANRGPVVAAGANGQTGGGGKTTPPPTGGGKTPLSRPAVRPGSKEPRSDDLIEVTHRSRTTGIATIIAYGQVVNKHDYPVASITLTFMYRDAAGRRVTIGKTDPCEHVPAKGSARFSTRLGELPEGMALQIIARSEPEPEGVVCWMVDTDEVRTEVEDRGRTLVMRGKVTNRLTEDVVDVRLLCDFIDRNGKVYPAVGKLTKAYRLKPGVEESYTVEKRGLMAAAGLMPQPLLRLVGRVE